VFNQPFKNFITLPINVSFGKLVLDVYLNILIKKKELNLYFDKNTKPLKDFDLVIEIGDKKDSYIDKSKIESFLIQFIQDYLTDHFIFPNVFKYPLNMDIMK
jgi:hypothetical protein